MSRDARDSVSALACRLLNAADHIGLNPRLTPSRLLRAYAHGLFPMGRPGSDRRIAWFYPDPRGVLPLDDFHLPRRLAETIGSTTFRVSVDRDFTGTIDACGATAPDRPDRWINDRIQSAWVDLFRMGHAHSIEVWQGADRAGGLYGVALGGAFFAESMFSRRRDGSKVALVHLVARLRRCGFTLLDTQFPSQHLAQFGGAAISRRDYRARLGDALALRVQFDGGADDDVGLLLRSAS